MSFTYGVKNYRIVSQYINWQYSIKPTLSISGFQKPIPYVFLRYAPGNAIGLYKKSHCHGGIQYVHLSRSHIFDSVMHIRPGNYCKRHFQGPYIYICVTSTCSCLFINLHHSKYENRISLCVQADERVNGQKKMYHDWTDSVIFYMLINRK